MQGLSYEKLSKEIEKYKKQKEDFAELFSFYKDVMAIVFRYREKTDISFNMSEEEIKNLLREGKHLLSVEDITIDKALFDEIKGEIIDVILQKDPSMTEALKRFGELDELGGEKLIKLLHKEGGFTPESLENYITDNSIDEKCGLDTQLILFIIFNTLTPFYMSYAGEASQKTDFALWSEGYCPVCGQKPMMAQIRKEDSARVLECWLCHTQWGFPRLECPFCDNKDHKKLRYFYVDEEKGRRVNVCEKCKSYLKTVHLKELGREVILDVENIFTIQLDSVAQKEGYKPGQDLYLLN